jgi:hypothetical protein
VSDRPVKPRPGHVWAFGGPAGHRDTITSVKRGPVGSWKLVDGQLVPLARATAMWVTWQSRCQPITVTTLLRDWVPIG